MTAVDVSERDESPMRSARKPWHAPFVTRFATAGAEAGDSGGGVDGDATKS